MLLNLILATKKQAEQKKNKKEEKRKETEFHFKNTRKFFKYSQSFPIIQIYEFEIFLFLIT